MNHAAIPWSSFLSMSRSSPAAVVQRLNSILAQHFENIHIVQKQQKRGRSESYQQVTKKTGLFSRMFRSGKVIQIIKTSVIEDHCLALINVVGGRAQIKYNSDSEKIEAQFAFLTLANLLTEYSRNSSFNARNSFGVGVHMPKSTHIAVYNAIIAVLSRPEFDFRDLIHTTSPLKGSAALVAGEYWRMLLSVLQLVLDLVFWAREEEMQFAANFFAMAIFRLPSVGGHVVDSLHQFHSRAAAHYRRLYPSSTRSSELKYASRKQTRKSKLAKAQSSTTITSKSSSTNNIKNNNTCNVETKSSNKIAEKLPPEKLPPTKTSSNINYNDNRKNSASRTITQPEKTKTSKVESVRIRSSSKQSFDFINANPVIFGWLTFQSKVPGVDSGRVVELMRKRKKEWNGRLRSSREFAMMLAASVVDHVQDVVLSSENGVIWWEEVPLYPVLADMVLLTLRRQFHLLVHPTDPSALDDYETRTALRSSTSSFNYDDKNSGSNRNNKNNNNAHKKYFDTDEFKSNNSMTEIEETEEQEGNLIFSLPFFNSVVKTCSHFFSADPVMRNALLRMVCRHIDSERVSSVGPCLNAIELWLFRLRKVSPRDMTKCMQLPCIRSTIYSLLKSSRFVCTCRGLTFITTVVQHLSDSFDDEAVLWFLRDILFDLFFELMLSWSSFIRRFFHDFLIHRVFKLKRGFLDIPSDRRLFEMFPGPNNNDERVRAYDAARSEFTSNRSRKKIKNRMRRRSSNGIRNNRKSRENNSLSSRPDAASLSPSDMALATKMEAYMRILLRAVNDPSSFDDKCCPNSDQRRAYILVSLESFSSALYDYYCDSDNRNANGASRYFEGEQPEMDISIDALMRRFMER